jgi:hypothetical protein
MFFGSHCFDFKRRRRLERFSNWYSLTCILEGGFFLRKKPLGILVSVYSYWRTALLIRQENWGIVSHPFPQKTRKWMGHPNSI